MPRLNRTFIIRHTGNKLSISASHTQAEKTGDEMFPRLEDTEGDGGPRFVSGLSLSSSEIVIELLEVGTLSGIKSMLY